MECSNNANEAANKQIKDSNDTEKKEQKKFLERVE